MKKNLFTMVLIGLGVALSGMGCHTTEDGTSTEPAKPAKTETKKAEAAKPVIPVPADSPFAKIKIGMGMKEVYDLIGQPTDTSAHLTGKSFIPYYYGGDTHRVEAIYKGQGRIVFTPKHAFTSDLEVLEINYDPKERGYN